MQSDRELLELAAKAAGMRLSDDHIWHEGAGQWVRWNPLTDDGDALRLAVRLRINVAPEYVYEGPWLDGGSLRDPYAATRRAIVRAAAALAIQEGQEARG